MGWILKQTGGGLEGPGSKEESNLATEQVNDNANAANTAGKDGRAASPPRDATALKHDITEARRILSNVLVTEQLRFAAAEVLSI